MYVHVDPGLRHCSLHLSPTPYDSVSTYTVHVHVHVGWKHYMYVTRDNIINMYCSIPRKRPWALNPFTQVVGHLLSDRSINGHGPVQVLYAQYYTHNLHSRALPLSGSLLCCYTALLRTSASLRFICATRRYVSWLLINYARKLAAVTLIG